MTDDTTLGVAAPGGVPAGPGATGATARALARAGLVVTLAYLLSRILGYVRYVAIGAAVGVGPELDAFFAAFRIPDFLFQLVAAGALSSALIPVVSGLLATHEDARAWRVVSTVTTLMLVALLILSAVVLVAAPLLVPVITPGFGATATAETVRLTRIMVLSPLLLATGAVLTSVLNAKGRFGAAATAPLVYNLAIILAAVFLAPTFGVTGLAVGVVFGALGHVLVQLPVVARTGARIRPFVDIGDPQARRAIALMGPRALGLGATQVVFLVMTSLASTLEPGSITVFNFAFALLQIPIGVIGVPLGVVLLPSLSREAATGANVTFRRLLVRALGLLAYVMVGIAALGIVMAGDVVRLAFGYGSVDQAALDRTALTLSVFLVGLTAHSMIAVLARSFYARQDTATPVVAALVAVGVNIVAGIALVGPFGLTGLATAIALAAWVELLTLSALMTRKLPGVGLGHVAEVLGRSMVAAAAGALVALIVEQLLLGAWGPDPSTLRLLVRTGLATLLGGGVMILASIALRIEELPTIVGVVVDLVRRRGRA